MERQEIYFYLENDEIVLLGNPGSFVGKIKVTYYIRPNALVPEDQVASIVAINGNDVVISGNINLFSVGGLIDIVSQKSPNKILEYDVQVTAINNTTNTLTLAEVVDGVVVGDQISPAETTAIAQIPTELQSLLSQRVAARCLEALGDQAGLQAANAKIAEIEQKAATLIDSRVEGSPWKINPSGNRLRSIRRRFWWGR